MLISGDRTRASFIFLVIFLLILAALDYRPLFAAFLWNKNQKDIEELKTEIEEFKKIIDQIQEEFSADVIKRSVREGTGLLIERIEKFKREIEILQEGIQKDTKGLEAKVETLREEFTIIERLKDEMQAWKADVTADIGESIQNIREEMEDKIGRTEVSNTNIVGNLQRSLNIVSKRLEDWERTLEDKDKEIAALKDTFAEEITSLESLFSEGLKTRDKEIDSIKSTIRIHSEDRKTDLSRLESTLTKSLIERDREIISLISDIQQELERKDEKFSAINEKFSAIKESVDNIHKRLNLLNQRLSFLEKTSTTSSSAKGAPAQSTIRDKRTKKALKGKGTGKDSTEVETLYSDARKAVKDKDYKSALRLLEDFLYRYPDTELSDNAQYWIGEVHYDQKDFSNAILAFDRVVNRYPIGDKVPDALLKEGLSFYNLGKLEMAKIFLKRVRKEYPETNLAAIANKNLQKIAERTEENKN